jgi:hypothetical protein
MGDPTWRGQRVFLGEETRGLGHILDGVLVGKECLQVVKCSDYS